MTVPGSKGHDADTGGSRFFHRLDTKCAPPEQSVYPPIESLRERAAGSADTVKLRKGWEFHHAEAAFSFSRSGWKKHFAQGRIGEYPACGKFSHPGVGIVCR